MASNYITLNRGYPVRTTRTRWNIPLLTRHICNEACRYQVGIDSQSGMFALYVNPEYSNGACKDTGQLVRTEVSLGPSEINLYMEDEKVIPDNVFRVYVYYPLSYVFEAVIRSPTSNGFTRGELIQTLRILYEFIYSEEERTADPAEYRLKMQCLSCGNKDLSQVSTTEEIADVDTECPICFSGYEKTACRLKCGHMFHEACLNSWMEKSATCPLCRSNVFECKGCDGSGIVSYTYTGVVVPLDARPEGTSRNDTNGVFGIHTFDLQDLCIENLFYDRLRKRLHIEVVS